MRKWECGKPLRQMLKKFLDLRFILNIITEASSILEIGEIPYGLGYTLAKNEFEKTLSMIPQMGYGLVMIAHSDELNDEKNGALYAEYKKLAGAEEKVIFGGRLGEYKYYDMDAVIASALDMCEKELQ